MLNGGLASGYLGKWLENFGDSVVRRDTKSHIRKNTKNMFSKGGGKKTDVPPNAGWFSAFDGTSVFLPPLSKQIYFYFFRFALSRGARIMGNR